MIYNIRKSGRFRFYGEPQKESLENGRYTLSQQIIDDRKHPEEVKADGDNLDILIEVFDGDELTHDRRYGIPNNDNVARRELLENYRKEIASGMHASQKA
jgi:hypothetical protein